ncbi:MAG: hypothetical protein HW405_46, partial [Candidatus Berkelbacteria bacterium]|nr:hypothetical protein [Candidatus Berkelbacteria bacterium]
MTRTIKQLLFGILLSLLIIVIAYLTSPLFRTTPIKIELNQNKISTLVVAHHDLVKHERSRIFREVAAKEKYRDVILVSPDHFNSGINSISTTNKTWHLTNSIILPDSDKINQLEKNLVTNQESAFEREHGITNILNDISTNFPDANIIPLIIKANTENDKIQKLNENLIKICPSNCLMINSIDFSHYQTGTLAEIHDSLSLRALENLDEKLAWQSETDSPQALTLATFWAKSNSTMNFHLGYHSNSAEIFQEPDSESTSYILGWYEERQQRSTNEISFMFAGDAMFGRGVYYKFPKLEKAFENLGDRFFWGTDVSMLNLEGPISKQNIFPNPAPDNLIFNFPPQTISVLKWLHINTVGLANNHTLNQGMSGFNNTIQLLKTNKINSIGNPGCDNDASLQTFASGKKKMSIIAINALECSSNIDEMIRSQKNLSNYVIIFVHWGNEYEKTH